MEDYLQIVAGGSGQWNDLPNDDGIGYVAGYVVEYGDMPGDTLQDISGSVTINVIEAVVTFDAQGGSPVPASQNLAYGSLVSEPSAPTLAGYSFTGWFTASSGGSLWNFGTDTVTGDMTLYAQWLIDQPGAFSKTSPADGNLSNGTSVTLNWTASAGATSYEYCLDETPGTTCTTTWVNVGNVLTVSQGGLPADSTFYWQVRAINANPSSTEADSGTWWTFIKDNTAPSFGLVADNPYEATGPGGANALYNAGFTDDNGIASQSCTPASGSLFPIGSTQVNCTGTDNAGNTSNVSFNIIVVDTTAPSLTLPANITQEATSASGAAVSFIVTASDLVDASPTINCAPVSGSTFPIGTTTVNCSATDDYSNTSNGSFTVTVQDTTAPTLNLPANITVPQTIPAGAVVNFTVTATDAVDASPTIACVPPSGSTFPVGTTTVNCSATDDYSNTSNGSFTVTVTAAPGGNLLLKPDFANAAVFPTPWQAFGFTKPYTNVLDCNFYNMGPCSVLFIAGNRSAMQRINRSGLAGDTYSFGMYSAANAAPAGGKYLVEVAFYNNFNRRVGLAQLQFNVGTHGFELVSGPATATGNYTKITFRFYYHNPSGRAWFDDAFLYFVGAP